MRFKGVGGRGEKGRRAKVLQTYRHTYRQTYRPSDEAGSRGAFAPKNNYFTCFIFFCSFTLLVCGEKNILQNLTNSQEPEPGVFGSLEPEPLGKKIRSRSRLKKKSGAGAAKKFAGSPALPTSNSIVHCL